MECSDNSFSISIKEEVSNTVTDFEGTINIKAENDLQNHYDLEPIQHIDQDMVQDNLPQIESFIQNVIPNSIDTDLIQNVNQEIVAHSVTMSNVTLTIKSETEDPFKNIQLIVKQEDVITSDLNPEINEPEKVVQNEPNIVPLGNDLGISIKEENNAELVTYDYPDIDDGNSMDSDDAEALGNVEACLQDEMDIKCENEEILQERQKEELASDIKVESDMTVTDTMLTPQVTNNMTESTNKYEFIMQIPNDVVKELKPIVQNGVLHHPPCNGEDGYTDDCTEYDACQHITETDEHVIDNNELFQLNSITGNFLTLEQEARIMSGERFPCEKCPKYFVTKERLRYHLNVHQTIENYANGRIRGRETRKKNQAKKLREMRNFKRVKPESDTLERPKEKASYACTCGKAFQRRSRMETCLRSHDYFESKNKYVTCTTCLKKFKNKEELSVHRKRAHRKKFSCKFCPTDYDTRKELFKHLQIHQKVQLMEYKVIEEVVKGKKALKCFLCTKTSTDLTELKTHVMLEHTGPYLCPHCKNTFPKIIDFGNHMKAYHPDVEGQSVLDVLEAFSRLVQEWKCEECDIQFLEPDKLALHQIEKHSPELKADPQFQCEDCRRVFISQKGLTSHRRIHHSIETVTETKPEELGIMCLECRTICKDINALTSHMRFHSPDRKYPCKFCDFRFATPEKRKAHLEIHTGDMKFVCFICEYQCSSENRLKQHKLSLKHANMKEYLLTGKPLVEESTSKEKVKEKKEGSAKKRKNRENSESKKDSSASSSDSEEIACDICGEKFLTEELMLDHKQTHPFIEFPNDDKPSRIFFK